LQQLGEAYVQARMHHLVTEMAQFGTLRCEGLLWKKPNGSVHWRESFSTVRNFAVRRDRDLKP
jgi:hypothetical protein